jgi:hypothetical protein
VKLLVSSMQCGYAESHLHDLMWCWFIWISLSCTVATIQSSNVNLCNAGVKEWITTWSLWQHQAQ